MRVFVTGATGFLGNHLVEKLLAKGYRVTATGRNLQAGKELEALGATFLPLELTHLEAVLKACKNQDRIIHSAALSSPWGKYEDFFQANVIGTENLLLGALENNLSRFVHVSSPSIYMDFKDRLNIREDDPLPAKGVNHYAETKKLAEQKVDWATNQGLTTMTIRPRAIFGPGDRAIFPRILRASQKGFLPLFNEQAFVDLTYVENVADALISLLEAPKELSGKKYNITNGEPSPIGELFKKVFQALEMKYNPVKFPYGIAYSLAHGLEKMGQLTGKEPVLTRYSVGVLAKNQTLNIEAAKRDFGYTPQVSLEQGIQNFAKWWKEYGNKTS